ncbi:uncharacterized protein LOC126824027 [Patella vulgata]|uniref:uncharacterized protein LOC126824027 n=1 Tax=Patella vulgata TaxID=6465 RepID=UPI00217F53C7|nr:uncharacterized protein LOC126824027 [Patella vulgata]XP_055957549.1 uncharacterized protein LOC126824027 [Patella vulgata]
MANRRRVMEKALQLMIQKYGPDEASLARQTNLLYIPHNVLSYLADISDPEDLTGGRDFHVVGEGFGLTAIQINAIRDRKRESSTTMAIFETGSKNGKTFMDILSIWVEHTIDGINRIVESWPETLQTKTRSESQNCSARASFLTPVQTSWNCASTRQSSQRSRRNNLPAEHHSYLHRQPGNLIDEDNESVVSQSTNVSNENNLTVCIAPQRPFTQYRPNIESRDCSNRVPPPPRQRICEPGSNATEGGNIPTFIQQNISLGDDDPRSLQSEITDSPENTFEDHHLFSAGPSCRFMEDPVSRYESVTPDSRPTFDQQVHNSTSSSPRRLEHHIVAQHVHNSTSSSPHRLECQIVDQPLQDGAHCMQNVGNESEMPLNNRSLNQEKTLDIISRNQYTGEWCQNNPLTLEEQQQQNGMHPYEPSTVAPTEPEDQVNEVQVFICGDDNEKNRTIVDKLAANFFHKRVSFVTDEAMGVKGFPPFSPEERQKITGDSEKFIKEVFKSAKFVLLLKSKRFMEYISVRSRSENASNRKHQERLCDIFLMIDEEVKGRNGREGRLLLLETDKELPPRFFSKLYDCFFKRNEA